MRSPFQSTVSSIFIALAVAPVFAGEGLEENVLEEEKPYSFKLSVSPAGGYNSNVILLGDGLPLPSGISQQGAGFCELGIAATSYFYFPPIISARNMDANNYSVDLSITLIPKDYDAAKFKLGYVHFRNDADGNDYDYERNRLQFSAETRFSKVTTDRLYDLKAIIKYFHDFDAYDHPNSHAGPIGFAFKRRADK